MLEKRPNGFSSFLSLYLRNSSRLGIYILKGGILCYQYVLSPLLGPTCRFYPSCSSYALAAVEKYGVIRGMWFILFRLAKCHPWHPGGIDPLH